MKSTKTFLGNHLPGTNSVKVSEMCTNRKFKTIIFSRNSILFSNAILVAGGLCLPASGACSII